MIEVINVIKKNARRNSDALCKRNYVSRNTVTNKDYKDRFNLPPYSKLRELAESESITAIKVYVEGTVSYWFLRDEIESLFLKPSNLTDNIKQQKQELVELHNNIIENIEDKANELLGIIDRPIKEGPKSVVIKAPYTINAVKNLWEECAEQIKNILGLKTNIIIELSDKRENLDAMYVGQDRTSSSSIDYGYEIIK